MAQTGVLDLPGETHPTAYDTAKVVASRIPPALASAVYGDPTAQTFLGRHIPGVVQQNVSQLGELGTGIYNTFGKMLPPLVGGQPMQPVEPPQFVQDATQHAEGARVAARADIPTAVEPQNAVERVAAEMTDSVMQALPLPNSLMRAVPTGLRAAVGVAAPGLYAPKIVAAEQAIGAGVGQGLQEYENSRPPEQPSSVLALPNTGASTVSAPTQTGVLDLPQSVASRQAQTASVLDLPAGTDTPTDTSVLQSGPESTSLTYGDYGNIAAASLLALGIVTPIGRITRGLGSARRAADAAKLNEAIGIRTGEISGPGIDATNPPPMPDVKRPGDRSMLSRVGTSMVDKNMRTEQIVRGYAETSDEAKELRAVLGQFGDKQVAATRNAEFLATGVDPITKEKLTPIERYLRTIGTLPEEKQNLLNRAMHADNERDDRILMVRQAMQKSGSAPGAPQLSIHDPNMRHGLHNESTADLEAAIAAAKADPIVKPFFDQYRPIKAEYLRHFNQSRELISDADAANLQLTHPAHVSTVDPSGRVTQLFGERDLTPFGGAPVRTAKAWDILQQQISAIYRSADLNLRNKTIIHTVDAAQQRDPNMMKLFTRRTDLDGRAVNDRESALIRIGTRNGAETWQVHDPTVYHLLEQGDAMLTVMMNAGAHATQIVQSNLTGTAAILGGKLFSLTTNLPRSILSAGIERPAGTSAGLIDKAMNTVTGGRLGYRGFDPTTPIGVADTLMRNIGAQFAKNLGNAIERGTSPSALMVRGMAGKHGAAKFADWLNNQYLKSGLHQDRLSGLGGQGGRASVEVRDTRLRGFGPRYLGEALKQRTSPVYSSVPELFQPRGSAYVIRAKKMLNDYNSIINDAMHSYYGRLNRGNARLGGVQSQRLAYETSQLTGAPGTHGTFMNKYAPQVPFLNPAMQGLARSARSVKESPFGTAFGITATIGPMLLAEQWLAMQGGPLHQDALEHDTTPQQQADNILLNFTHNPHGWSMISVPQQYRWAVAPMRNFIKHMLNFDDAKTDPESHSALSDMLARFFGSYVDKNTAQSMLYGATQNIDPLIQLPTMGTLATALTGFRVRPQIDRLLQAASQGRDMFGQKGALTQPITEPYHLPGQDTSFNSKGDLGVFQEMLGALFGQVVGAAHDVVNDAKQANTFHGFMTALGDTASQHIKDSNRIATGILWPNAALIQPRGDYAQQQVQNTLSQLRELTGAEKSQELVGLTRRGGETVPVTGESIYPTDPAMAQVFDIGTGLRKYLEKNVQPHIVDLDKQRQQIDNVTEPQTDKREQRNRLALEIRAAYRQAAEIVNNANSAASNTIGRPVDFAQRIDWTRGADQFQMPGGPGLLGIPHM